MAHYICEDCGHVFNHPKAIQESRGEFWGMPCSETIYCCPNCGSDCISDFEGNSIDCDDDVEYDMGKVDETYYGY